MKLVLKQLSKLRGSIRMPLLAPDAADALIELEKDTDGLVYADFWRDGISSLLAKRLNKSTHLPGYSSHNFGFGIDVDVKTVLAEKKILYEYLLHLMKKRGWYCRRRDGEENQLNSNHFDYLGPEANKYLYKCTLNPETWDMPAEQRIIEKYNPEFQLPLSEVQIGLAKLGMFKGQTNGTSDVYTREAILAFQRAWDLIPNGYADYQFCRVLSFVTADIDII